MTSLETMFNKPFYRIQKEYRGELPPKIDLRPYDGHPNREGLQFYADAITKPALATEIRGAAGRGNANQ